MNFLKKIFHRRRERKPSTLNPKPLTISGLAPAPLTAEPDASEKAAEALLASLANEKGKVKSEKTKTAAKGSKEYYEQLSEKVKAAHEQERRAAMRYVAFAESELRRGNGQGESKAAANSSLFTLHSSFQELESDLFRHQAAVEREGGELLRRWQHCLAEVTLKQMQKYKLSTQ